MNFDQLLVIVDVVCIFAAVMWFRRARIRRSLARLGELSYRPPRAKLRELRRNRYIVPRVPREP